MRAEKPERNRKPEILDADKVEQDKPALSFPYLAPQLADEMGFPETRGADDHAAQRLIIGVRVNRFQKEIVTDIVNRLPMQARNMIGRVPPDALQFARPIEVDCAEGVKLAGHRSIQRMWRGSTPKYIAAFRSASVLLSSGYSEACCSSCILFKASSSAARSMSFSFSRMSQSRARVLIRLPVT